MALPDSPFRPLSHSLIHRILWLALACALLLGGFKAFRTYQEVETQYTQAVQQVAEHSLPLLSLALWDIEVPAVQKQVAWLAGLADVGWVEVRADIGQTFSAGDPTRADPASRLRFDILAPNGSSRVGTLEIQGNRDRLILAISSALLQVLLEYLVFTLVICLAVWWILRRDLQAPLKHIADFAGSLRPGQLTQPLHLQRQASTTHDEIDRVARGIQQLQAELRSHIETLDHTVEARTRELNELVSRMHHRSITDPVTGCYNRHLLDERLPSEIERSMRHQRPLAILFVDIDHFKRINDQWGHAVGDTVLRAVCQRLLAGIRTRIDWLARYGGEEFVVVLPERDLLGASQVAERLRQRLALTPLDLPPDAIAVTASIGVAEYRPGESATSLMERADASVYEAKRLGRNRVVCEGQPASLPPTDKVVSINARRTG